MYLGFHAPRVRRHTGHVIALVISGGIARKGVGVAAAYLNDLAGPQSGFHVGTNAFGAFDVFLSAGPRSGAGNKHDFVTHVEIVSPGGELKHVTRLDLEAQLNRVADLGIEVLIELISKALIGSLLVERGIAVHAVVASKHTQAPGGRYRDSPLRPDSLLQPVVLYRLDIIGAGPNAAKLETAPRGEMHELRYRQPSAAGDAAGSLFEGYLTIRVGSGGTAVAGVVEAGEHRIRTPFELQADRIAELERHGKARAQVHFGDRGIRERGLTRKIGLGFAKARSKGNVELERGAPPRARKHRRVATATRAVCVVCRFVGVVLVGVFGDPSGQFAGATRIRKARVEPQSLGALGILAARGALAARGFPAPVRTGGKAECYLKTLSVRCASLALPVCGRLGVGGVSIHRPFARLEVGLAPGGSKAPEVAAHAGAEARFRRGGIASRTASDDVYRTRDRVVAVYGTCTSPHYLYALDGGQRDTQPIDSPQVRRIDGPPIEEKPGVLRAVAANLWVGVGGRAGVGLERKPGNTVQ